jgi:hypothetical protein
MTTFIITASAVGCAFCASLAAGYAMLGIVPVVIAATFASVLSGLVFLLACIGAASDSLR